MNDWRNKPRSGKAQFMKHITEIRKSLDSGETQNAIRTRLMEHAGLSMSPSQFSRYVKKFGIVHNTESDAPDPLPTIH